MELYKEKYDMGKLNFQKWRIKKDIEGWRTGMEQYRTYRNEGVRKI